MQTEPQKDTCENKIVAVMCAQAADQIKQKRRDEQRIKREAQPDAGDDIGPIADAREERTRSSPHAGIGNFLSEQINIRQCEKA